MYTALDKDGKPLPTVTISSLKKMKENGEKIACLTAYDASFAALEDQAGVDVVLVGDSLGMVVQGRETTVPVTMDDIIYHSKAVSRGLQRAFLMVDLPFLTYNNPDQAINNAQRLMQEGGAKMVKLEGNSLQADIVEYMSARGVPVCAHLGLQPQLIHKLGGFRVQGRDSKAAKQMKKDAKILEEAGADCLLLECIPADLAKEITDNANVPVIGIGAGVDTDGQILVLYDILDITPGRKPRFAHNFMAGQASISDAVSSYVTAVKDQQYPQAEHTFS